MTIEARLFTVHGRVQGVWFRDSTRREARRLGISGHAINLSNGSVEVLAVGPDVALQELALRVQLPRQRKHAWAQVKPRYVVIALQVEDVLPAPAPDVQ